MPLKIRVVWVISCILFFFGYLFLSAKRSGEEVKQKMEQVQAEKLEQRKQQIKKKQEEAARIAGKLKVIWDKVSKNKLDEVEKQLQEFLQTYPDNAQAYMLWGTALVEARRLPEALEKFDKSAQLDNLNARNFIYWGLALSMQERYVEAIPRYKVAVQLEPENSNAHAYWGNTLSTLGKQAEAVERLEQALKYNPANEVALKGLVESHYKNQEFGKAWETVSRARKNNVVLPDDLLGQIRRSMPEPVSGSGD